MNTLSKELKGKRLLILGGSLWKDAIKQFCDEHGIIMIAAGNDPSAGICDIAEEYYNVNSTDPVTMKILIRERSIDGVYMGGSEPVIAAACQYINDLGLPCYCNKLQWDTLQNKMQFKELCRKFGLPIVKRFTLSDVKDDDFPLITKPADGCASNGFSVCKSFAELQKGYEVASEASPTGSVIIEQFVPNDGVVVFYTVSNGKLIFSVLEDKYPTLFEKYGTYVGGLFDFESELTVEFREKFEDKLQKMIESLGIQEGNFWIEVFHDKEKYYFNEVGFRYGGSGSLYPIDYCRGINQVAVDIYYALTGKSQVHGFTPLYSSEVPHGKKYAIYPLFLSAGKIGRVSGIEQIRDICNVMNILPMKKEGSIIPDNGSFGQVAMLIHFIYDDLEDMKSTIHKIHEIISVQNVQGADMTLQLLKLDKFRFR